MRTEPRSAPSIPDHEVLRKIGSGAYGEVWLARSVTGRWRAAKVVCREDFEDERSFEREFEGILKYEPISRDHPALVHVLHVGRIHKPEPLYYYVMELGDDCHSGQQINAVEYEPRTLRTEVQPDGHRIGISVDEVLDIGISLADGLQHLHDNGLVHRDVKPANVIFVEGRAKLADLGLVAVSDQRTFVGTEGFVPPEGPGSAMADIYSLGKVLYELATGLDRLQFPELPDELPEGESPAKWRKLNEVICDICEPRQDARRIRTGAELTQALRALKEGRRVQKWRGRRLVFSLLMAVGVIALIWGLPHLRKEKIVSQDPAIPTQPDLTPSETEPAKSYAEVFILSDPGFAKVSLANGEPVVDRYGEIVEEAGVPFEVEVGTELRIKFTLDGYRSVLTDSLVVGEEGADIYGELVRLSLPERDLQWTDSLGMNYTPKGEYHRSDQAITLAAYRGSLADGAKIPPTVELTHLGQPYRAVLLTPDELDSYLDWLKQKGVREGGLSADFELTGVVDERVDKELIPAGASKQGRKPYRIDVQEIFWGSISLNSDPPGAAVIKDGILMGFTGPNFKMNPVKPGLVSYVITLNGFKKETLELKLKPNENLIKNLRLTPNNSAQFGKDWQNSLGMDLIAVGDSLLVAKYETRVSEYEAFLQATNASKPEKVLFEQAPDHPVSMVSYREAREFCAWLTRKEQTEDRINQFNHYRLPTDAEWSLINGLEEKQASPRKRHARRKQYPWGKQWPPGRLDAPPGNFADRKAAAIPGVPTAQTIPNYNDGYSYTSPTGTYPANELGFHDLAGNVREWMVDSYGGNGGLKTRKFTRGGGFLDFRALSFDLGHRHIPRIDAREPDIGFRVVLARNPDAFQNP